MVDRVHGAERQALTALFRTNSARINGLLIARCGDRALAEELTAQTFEAAAVQFARRRGDDVTPAWLTTVALRPRTGPPRPGDPVETVGDAVAELEAEGFELAPRDDDVTILGATARSFDFVGPSVEPWLWFPLGNGVSGGFGFVSGEPGSAGELHIAETPAGVIVVSLHGQAGTDDADIPRERFAVLLETLRPAADGG